MIEIGHFQKLLILLKTIDLPLNGVDTAVYRYIVIFIDTFHITIEMLIK